MGGPPGSGQTSRPVEYSTTALRQRLLLQAGRREHRLQRVTGRGRHGRDPPDVHEFPFPGHRANILATPGRDRHRRLQGRQQQECGPSCSQTSAAPSRARRRPSPRRSRPQSPRRSPRRSRPTHAKADSEADSQAHASATRHSPPPVSTPKPTPSPTPTPTTPTPTPTPTPRRRPRQRRSRRRRRRPRRRQLRSSRPCGCGRRAGPFAEPAGHDRDRRFRLLLRRLTLLGARSRGADASHRVHSRDDEIILEAHHLTGPTRSARPPWTRSGVSLTGRSGQPWP